MKKKVWRLFSLLMAVLLMTAMVTACGDDEDEKDDGGNPFVGAWDNDADEISFIFNEDGTGEQASYSGSIPFTYTVDGNIAQISNEEYGITFEAEVDGSVMGIDGSNFNKVDSPKYTPENKVTGGSEDELNGSFTNGDGDITISFDGAGGFGYSNNRDGVAGNGGYTYDGETLTVTYYDGDEISCDGYVSEDGSVVLPLWDYEEAYYPE